MQTKLLQLQSILSQKFGCKVDLYREEGKGVLAVEHGKPLIPSNVIFSMEDWQLELL